MSEPSSQTKVLQARTRGLFASLMVSLALPALSAAIYFGVLQSEKAHLEEWNKVAKSTSKEYANNTRGEVPWMPVKVRLWVVLFPRLFAALVGAWICLAVFWCAAPPGEPPQAGGAFLGPTLAAIVGSNVIMFLAALYALNHPAETTKAWVVCEGLSLFLTMAVHLGCLTSIPEGVEVPDGPDPERERQWRACVDKREASIARLEKLRDETAVKLAEAESQLREKAAFQAAAKAEAAQLWRMLQDSESFKAAMEDTLKVQGNRIAELEDKAASAAKAGEVASRQVQALRDRETKFRQREDQVLALVAATREAEAPLDPYVVVAQLQELYPVAEEVAP